MFGGEMSMRTRCLSCCHVASRSEIYEDIALPISQSTPQGLWNSDVNKDWTPKDKSLTLKDKDEALTLKDKDLKLVRKASSMTKINITVV